ncbi:MAG: hypothetical protein MH204_03570, partial [Fimbriimonadaceae bacterium]|nr:hypothetical protein [Fimbriimonadaceae bacterium]
MSGTLKIAALLVVGTTVLASAAWVEAQRAPAKTVVGNLSFGPIVYTDASYRPLRKQPTSFKGGEDFIFTI